MASTVPPALIDSATAYEAMFVPALFAQWAPIVADAVNVKRGDRVLDIACGTGVLTREAAARAGPSGSVTGLDPHAGMLAVARGLAPTIDWQQGAAEALPFPDRSFDAVVCQFGLMFFSDRNQAIREMSRVMLPGGRGAVAVWDSIENVPAFAALVALLDRSAGTAAGDALRAPFVLGDRQVLTTLFQTIGAAPVDVTTHRGTARFPSTREFVEAELRGWLPVMGVILTERETERVLAEAEAVFSSYVTGDGRLEFDISAHIVRWRRG
jgi:SAM-dependent methyltransferase